VRPVASAGRRSSSVGRPQHEQPTGEVMRVFAPRTDQTATRRILLATGLGTIFGFQSWRLAEHVFALSVPWYGQAWIWLSPVFLAFAIGATAGWTSWWRRAPVFGLAFSLPSGCGALALGLRWVPFSIAAITEDMVVALLIAFLADAIFPCKLEPSDRHSPEPARLPGAHTTGLEERCTMIKQRLAGEKSLLDQLDSEREYRGDSNFQKTAEDRIIWGELLDLELQDFDEQLNRIRQTAGDASGRRADKSDDSPGSPSD
jgi:hypothetical protein